MKNLHVIAAALGYETLLRNKRLRMAGLDFGCAKSVFPALTCVHQAALRTGKTGIEAGLSCNGVWMEDLRKPLFWEQSSRLVKGGRIWSEKTGLFFLQQSLGEDVEVIVSPAPIHKHSGGMIRSAYVKMPGLSEKTTARLFGKFPLHKYWGPLSDPKVGRVCIEWFKKAVEIHDVDDAYLYLPTLDYMAQKYGPESAASLWALSEFESQLEILAQFCEKKGARLTVGGDYEITSVDSEPLLPNVLLRREGFFKVRRVGSMTYPDFYSSTAFCMCDHEVAVVCGEEKEKAKRVLEATGDYEFEGDIAVARHGSWCAYQWWTNKREAPDYASHVDIHNKPGFDPLELFFFNRGKVKGTHGRRCDVAVSI
jgi:predicted AlkP superfamily pyrophosphatase or phosphodiesterase